jgi:hypothetical protein
MPHRRFARAPLASALALALALLAAACGSGGTAASTTTTSTTESTGTTAETTTTAPTTTSTTIAGVEPLAIDPAWVAYADDFFVWGVQPDDVLNVRAGPGVSNPIITTLDPNQQGVRRFDVTEFDGDDRWGVIEVADGAGWVNLAFVRPAGTRPPATEGTIDPRTETAADDVQALLGAGEYETLSGFVDPDSGVVISVDAFVADDAQVLTAEQLAGAATDDTVLLWGYTDGEGAPIETTIAERLETIAGNPGITSTDVIGFDVRVGTGNSIDNIADRFPDAHVVEYHFDGTSLYGDFDWSSVRFVFDTENTSPTGRPALLAIVQDTWTI